MPTSTGPAPPLGELPLHGEPRHERADAARNRERILEAAGRLFAEHGVEEVTMEDVARAAGVAKGTVFHRFGDRSGLALALLDEHERELQDAILRGPPPLGPGAPARERLIAFCDALLALLEEHAELLFASETSKPRARYTTGAYDGWIHHVSLLVREQRPDADAELVAHLLLAPFAAELHTHLRRHRGIDAERLRRAIDDAASRLIAAG